MSQSNLADRTALEALADSGQVPDRTQVIRNLYTISGVTQYHLVEIADDGTEAGIQHPATAGNKCIGIALETVAANAECPVLIAGFGLVKCGAAIVAGGSAGLLAAATTGKAATATAGQHVAAVLLVDSSADGDNEWCYLPGSFERQKVESFGFAAAAGGSNVCEVTVTAKGLEGGTLAGVYNFDIWLSDAATGLGLTGTSASGTVTVKTASGAVIGTFTAKKALRVQSLAAGTFILEITDSAKTTFYVCAQASDMIGPSISTILATGDYG